MKDRLLGKDDVLTMPGDGARPALMFRLPCQTSLGPMC